jgi:branched-chain amino acid transport system substrate-binding protein
LRILRIMTVKLLAICFLASQLGISIASENGPILVGAVGAMKRNKEFAEMGRQMVKGVQAQTDSLNATTGVAGRKVKLIVADDKCDPDTAMKVARDLVSKGVKVVIGHFCPGAAIAAAPIYQAAGIIEISPSATNPYFTEQGWWNTFRTAPRDDQQAIFIGQYVAKRFAGKSIAVANDGSIYGDGLAEKVRMTLDANGNVPYTKMSYDANKPDYRAVASQLKSINADVVFVGGYAPEAAKLLKAMRAVGLRTQMIGPDSFTGVSFGRIAGKAADGTIYSFTPDARETPHAKPLVQEFRRKGIDPVGYTLPSYAALELWASAANSLNTIDGKQISNWLRAGNKIDTALGQISMDRKGDLKEQKFIWYKFAKGRSAADTSIK